MRFFLQALVACALVLCFRAPVRAQGFPREIRDLKLRDWKPRPMLKAKRTVVKKPAVPVIDVHNHLGRAQSPKEVRGIVRTMKNSGVELIVNLDGGSGAHLEKQLDLFDRAYPGKFATFALIDFRGFDDKDWSKRTTEQLERDFKAGAKGLKFHKAFGLWHKHSNGKLIRIDNRKLDPIFKLCAKYKRPVVIHTADPAAFFTKMDEHNERWHELVDHPGWLFADRSKYPSRKALLSQRNRVIARHPKTTFIGAHFGNNPEDLSAVAKWLDKYANFVVDIDARISELGRQPYSTRKFLIKYQDRVLFGTDSYPDVNFYRLYYRFLETDDEYWDPAESHHRQGFWMIYGIFLPEGVLRKIYRDNARRVLQLDEAQLTEQ